MMEGTTIIPVGGGKGGVGKSFVTANTAIALAQQGANVVAIDLDLGNSNLHGFLGISNTNAGVGELLAGRIEGPLVDLAVETGIEGLRFIAGDGRMPLMANMTYHQKMRLRKEIRAIDADYVLLDLSAGTTFNTLDLCLLADSCLLVTTPDYASLMSALVFVKNLLLRVIDRSIGRNPELLDHLQKMYVQSVDEPVARIDELLSALRTADADAAKTLEYLCGKLRPRLVLNMGDESSDLDVLAAIDRSLDEILNLECDHLSFLPFDPVVRRGGRKPEPFILDHPDSRPAEAIRRLASRIERFWDRPIADSATLLRRHTEASFEAGVTLPGPE